MKRILLLGIAAALTATIAQAKTPDPGDPINLLSEYFYNMSGNHENPSPVDPSLFPGWEFKDVYAGKECLLIKKGGSITLPTISNLADNAQLYFNVGIWEQELQGEEPDYSAKHTLSIVNGELSSTEFDPYSSMSYNAIYGAGPNTQVTITFTHPSVLTAVRVFYAGLGDRWRENNYTVFSHEAGEYYAPFDLELIKSNMPITYGDDGEHNILLYTLDGSTPTRTSTRYDGTTIHISENTTVTTATIFGNGALAVDNPKVYTFGEVSTPEIPEATYTVALTQAGTLKSRMLDLDVDRVDGLVLSGPINGVDLAYLVSGTGMLGQIQYLDMADVTFEYDNSQYMTKVFAPEGGMGTVTTIKYFFSAENSTERTPTGGPTTEAYNVYSNDLTYAFGNLSKLERISLPKCLKTIGASCCASNSISMVTLPEGVTEIGSNAFNSRNLSNINFPESLKIIGSYAFGGTSIMSNLNLPNVEEIGYGAFAGTKLINFVFGKNLKYIGESAFAGTLLDTVDMPFPPDSIMAGTFSGCDRLKTVNLGEGVKYIGKNAFSYTILSSIVIPETVEEIGSDAFPSSVVNQFPIEDGIRYIGKVAYIADSGITSANVKEGTVSLSDGLFAYNYNLTSVTLPQSLRIIGEEAFACTGLTATPDMPGVERINNWAFRHCSSMTRVTLPESLKVLDDAFYGCDAIWRLDYNAIDCQINAYGGVFGFGYNRRNKLEKVTIGPNVKRLPAGIYNYSNNFSEITLPESVEIIDANAFYDAHGLQTVKIPGRITSLGESAFNECEDLKSVEFGAIEVIPDYAFSRCPALESVIIPEGVREIGIDAFYNTPALKEFNFTAGLKTIGGGAFSDSGLENIELPEGLEFVGNGAFNPCKNVKTLYIPSTLQLDEESYGAFCMLNEGMECVVTNMMPVPTPQVSSWAWNYNNRVAEIRIPAEYIKAYREDAEWSKLAHLFVSIGEEENAVDEIGVASQAEITDWYDLKGNRIAAPTAPGLYIIRRADGSTAKQIIK